MKRTGEITLGIIGIVFSALTSLLGMLFLFLGSDAVKSEIANDPTLSNDPAVSMEEMEGILGIFSGAGWAIIIAAIIGIILGIIAVINVKGDKNPKLGGWLNIIGAVLMGIISLGAAFLPALLFLIAGIMCFVRKLPIEEPTNSQIL
ncbi:DUF4064 domain-containing protein [Lederbergia sp. NSJ-179]|uniref:DUF4064 domain-containing protein n=1 Tax=Lederbergia sp. NSJ-179 TaxID=2931402 RepID=UPI001FD32BA5|nr:DUF4064 domain-containing protein [Lederbergia sp. NSJ-179]MCJ7839540.1 DUF4064 domain-containing protein [Lederbergia sp. NSJ-179]